MANKRTDYGFNDHITYHNHKNYECCILDIFLLVYNFNNMNKKMSIKYNLTPV